MPNVPAQDQRSRRDSVWVAALGNTVLALAGGFGSLLLLLAMGMMGTGEEMSSERYARIAVMFVSVFGPIALGFYLAVGYWKAALRGAPSATPRRFWWTSAIYNGIGAVIWAWLVAMEAGRVEMWVHGSTGIGWTGFMLVLSVAEARRDTSP